MQAREVTKDMVRDLLPVYLAGDASADTRAVVEAFLAQDADLRQIVENAGHYSLPALEAPASLEVRSLERTRRLLGRKNFWLGFALIFTLAPLILKPWWLADITMLIGLGGWAPFLMACRELNATGLETPRGWAPRSAWYFVSSAVGWIAGYLIQPQPIVRWPWMMSIATMGVAMWIGEKLHQFQTGEELNRPTTLFGK